MTLLAQIILFTIIALIWIWVPGMFVLGCFGGWWDLARKFPKQKPNPGAAHGSTSVVLPPFGQYKRIVLFAADDDCLHLRLLPALFLFHPPMSIPWAEIDIIAPIPTNDADDMIAVTIRGRDLLLPRRLLEPELQIRDAIETMT